MLSFLNEKRFEDLRECLVDKVHQPYRLPLINNSLDILRHHLALSNSKDAEIIIEMDLGKDYWYKFVNGKDKILCIEPDYGSWGSFPIPEMVFIGKAKIAFKYVSSYGGQGQFETHLDLVEYDDVNFKFKSILSLDYGFSDAGYYAEGEEHNDWEGNIFIIKAESLKKWILMQFCCADPRL